jgi:hypothetical protein
MRTFVVMLNGPPRAGKDTLIDLAKDLFKNDSTLVLSYSSIDPVKDMLKKAGLDLSKKTLADRKLLSVVGDALEEHSSLRTAGVIHHVRMHANRPTMCTFLLFIHMREPVLIKRVCSQLKKMEGVEYTTLLMDSIRAENVVSNVSDLGVFNMTYDDTVRNDGTLDDLKENLCQFLDKYALLPKAGV